MRTKSKNFQQDSPEPGACDVCVHLCPAPPNAAGPSSEGRIKTLVVDDSPLMLKILAQILEDLGDFDLIGTAPDGCRALHYVTALSPELVLMDVHLPHLNGIQATQYIKQFQHPPVVIIISSDDSPSSMELANKAGADGFIVKGGNLRHRLTRVLQDLGGAIYANRERASSILPRDEFRQRQAAGHQGV